MASGSVSKDDASVEVWNRTCQVLRRELGEATFGSWLGQASLREQDGGVCLVAATGVARDWIRRHAWRRIGELWAQNDPMGRSLALKSKMEFEGQGAGTSRDVQAPSAAPATPAGTAHARSSADPAPAPAPASGSTAVPPPSGGRLQGLQERFSFETFVPGPSNEFAFAVARRVASWADGHFNPVLFHGPYGFGKTHLLNALAWEAMQTGEARRVVYLTAERFTSTFVRAIQDRQTAAFKAELRNADLLLIDDVHFVAGKQNTQEELFHTFESLYQANAQIVLSSDRPPDAISTLEDRLRSRFKMGLITEINPPELETRLAILRKKAEREPIAPPPDVLEFIASNITNNIRELEGALIRVCAFASLTGNPLTVELAEGVLGDILTNTQPRPITPALILEKTSEMFDFTIDEIRGQSRRRPLVTARQIGMYVMREMTDLSYPAIAREFGGRDHTTVIHAVEKISGLMKERRQIYDQVTELTHRIRNG